MHLKHWALTTLVLAASCSTPRMDIILDRAVVVSRAFGILLYAHRACMKQTEPKSLKASFESVLHTEPGRGKFLSFNIKQDKNTSSSLSARIETCRKEALLVGNASLNKDIASGRFSSDALVEDTYTATGTLYPQVSGKFHNRTGTFNGTLNRD